MKQFEQGKEKISKFKNISRALAFAAAISATTAEAQSDDNESMHYDTPTLEMSESHEIGFDQEAFMGELDKFSAKYSFLEHGLEYVDGFAGLLDKDQFSPEDLARLQTIVDFKDRAVGAYLEMRSDLLMTTNLMVDVLELSGNQSEEGFVGGPEAARLIIDNHLAEGDQALSSFVTATEPYAQLWADNQ